MKRLSLIGICAVLVLAAGCEPEPRRTTPARGNPSAATTSPRESGATGLSPAQMNALRRLMTLRRQAARLVEKRRLGEAMVKLRAAMRIAPTIFGPRHPFPAQVADQIAESYEAAGAFPQAVKAYDRVIALWRRALNVKEHEPVVEALRKKGLMLMYWGKTDRAVAVLSAALAMWQRVAKLESGRYGPFYVYLARGKPIYSLAMCNMNLGEAYLRHRRLEQAEKYLLHALALTRRLKSVPPYQTQLQLNLAFLYHLSSRHRKAAHHYEKLVGIMAKAGPKMQKSHLTFQLRLAEQFLLAGSYGSAYRVIASAQKHTPSLGGPGAAPVLHMQIILAAIHLGSGRYKAGAALLKALGPKVAALKKAAWVQARYHLAVARQHLGTKRRVLAMMAAVRAVTATRPLSGTRPIHLLAYSLVAKTTDPARGFMYTAVAYWVATHLGARDQPSGKRLAADYCRLSKMLPAAKVTKNLIYARAEARNAQIKPLALPTCR